MGNGKDNNEDDECEMQFLNELITAQELPIGCRHFENCDTSQSWSEGRVLIGMNK